jgi:hypothetical protein
MITDGDGKINAVEIRRQNIKVFTDALALLNLI